MILSLFHKVRKGKLAIKACFIKHLFKIFSYNVASSLLIWAFFVSLAVPKMAEASFFSSILNNNEASADMSTPSSNNSQTMALLQANVSSAQIFQKKDGIDLNANINIVSNNSLLPSTSIAGSSSGNDAEDFSFDQPAIYVVKPGDTVSKVAEMFDVSVDTILIANDLKKGESLKEGDILLILPFSGIEHTVQKGQTLKGIAAIYKVDLNEILLANDELEIDTVLVIGQKIMIPGAEIADEPVTTKPKPATVSKNKVTQSSLPSVSGFFKNPVPGARRTRGIKPGHRGVDLAAPIGTPIYAAASGTVIIARMGYNGGFGNYVVIQHSNGTKTLYAHMSKLGTTPGEKVSQGEVIGYVGSTGHSTGPHLHIEVLGGKNPF